MEKNNKKSIYLNSEIQRNTVIKRALLKTTFVILSVLYFIFTIVALIGYNYQLHKKTEENTLLKNTISQLEQSYNNYQHRMDLLDNQIILLSNRLDKAQLQLNEFTKYTQSKIEEINLDKFELYKYAMQPTKYNKHYLNDHQMSLVLEYSDKYKLDPNLVLGVMWVESRYYSKAKSKSSTASGYGQFIKSTGEWTHSYLLKRKDKYDHKVNPFNPDDAIPMMCAYLHHLVVRNKGDIKTVLIRYNGNELGKKYYQMIDEYFTKVSPSISLESIERNIKNRHRF